MRVVLLVTDLERGGTPLRLAALARRLKNAALEVHVGCLAPRGPLSDELEAAGIQTFACGARSIRDLFAFSKLAAHLKHIQPDLVHATLTHANVAARFVGRRLGIPVVTSTATIEVKRRWHLMLERWTAHMDRGHIVNSAALAAHVTRAFRLPPGRIHLVPPFVDPPACRVEAATARRQLELPEEAFIVAWVGRFDPEKRLDLAVRCVELLADLPCRLLLAGEGRWRAQLEKLVASSPARRRIRLLGWQDNLATLLSAADVFLFPSRTEGMPNAVLQAMAFGLPVVGSDIPALRELSGDAQRLMLVPGHDPARYATALRDLYENAHLRAALGRRSAEWVAGQLDPEKTVRATIAVYKSVLEHANGQRSKEAHC